MTRRPVPILAGFLLIFALVSSAPGARRVLFLGDSFSKGAFGTTLDAQLRAAGLEVYTSVTGGASAYDWLPEYGTTSCDIGYWEKTPRSERRVSYIARIPKLDTMISSWRPDVVVIQGGTNMYSVLTSKRRSRDGNIAEFERLLDRVGELVRAGGARLYWITPATAHPDRFSPGLQAEMRSMLSDVAGRYGRVFDSYAVTRFTDPYPGTDGIHYGPTEAAAWARLVAKDLVAFVRAGERQSGPPEPPEPRSGRDEDDEGRQPPKPRNARRGWWDIFRRDRASAESGPDTGSPSITIRRAELVRPQNRAESARPSKTPRADSPPPPRSERAHPGEPLEVEVRLRQKSAVRTLNEVTYRSALGVFEYDVLNVRRGQYPHSRIRIAHLIVMNNRHTSMNSRPLGSRMSLTVEPLSKYPNLEKVQTVDDLEENFSLPVFVPKL